MQLKSFDKNEKQKNNKTTILVVVVFLFVVTLVLGKSFALYQKEEDKNVLSATAEICTVKSGTTWDFEYVEDAEGNGYTQEFKSPCTGNYRLETWGAQGGGNTTYKGGYGGYSVGEITLNQNKKIYVTVGEEGKYCTGAKCTSKASFNGGGSSKAVYNDPPSVYGSGGGATHIATETGILASLKNNLSSIIMVSGGGGGGNYLNAFNYAQGGHGGGFNGTPGVDIGAPDFKVNGNGGKGGTQSSGYDFGLGSAPNGVGGGGGFYGGIGTNINGAGGGSGYIGNEKLHGKAMYCYNCEESTEISTRTISTTNVSDNPISNYAKKGNGHARITYLGYNDLELNGADPVLKDGLIPVKIENDGTVRKANPQAGWYNYSNKEWANAVILVDKTKSYEYGAVIPESNIESYFVWIPKFSYKIWNLSNTNVLTSSPVNNANEIQIRFGLDNTSDGNDGECTTPMESGSSGNCAVGDFMTHPAFISLNTNGIWVGKFETGYKGATTTSQAEVNSNDSSKIIIKPNTYSWRSNTVYNQFVSSYNYQRTLDSHMMKNTEWGAVAYLSHSKYGINNEVRINNNSNYLTGYSSSDGVNQTIYPGTTGKTLDKTQPYNTSIGYKASTTGNITGVYDMSGGSHEYVAGYINGNYGSSGFNATTIANYTSKYFDVYNSSSDGTTYQYRILGDATGELGVIYSYTDNDGTIRNHNWYSDHSDFLNNTYPLTLRGGACHSGVIAGQFNFNRYEGGAYNNVSSRIVLAP